jgi:hypothetical protein
MRLCNTTASEILSILQSVETKRILARSRRILLTYSMGVQPNA